MKKGEGDRVFFHGRASDEIKKDRRCTRKPKKNETGTEDRQTIDTLITEEALLFAKYLRNERRDWNPRLQSLSVEVEGKKTKERTINT